MPSRREILKGACGVAGISALIPGQVSASEPPKRVLRVAHATDVHLQPELRGPEGWAQCLHHIQSQSPAVDFILLGGDHIMNSYAQPRERVQVQWDVWKQVVQAESSIPIYSCLGNQDIFGWNKAASKTTGTEPEYGKKWAMDSLELESSYYSFSRAGWHFIALDGLQPGEKEGSLSSYFDEAQFAWLERELKRVPAETPILIWTHVPIVTILPALMVKRTSLHDDVLIGAGNAHTDAQRILKLFEEHPNVKACFSGHLHRVEHINYRGIDFYTTGAVCAAWWKGPLDGFAEGYSLIDLYDDGTHTARYVPYEWKAVSA